MRDERTTIISDHDIQVISKLKEITEKGNNAEVRMKDGELTVMDVSKKKVL